MKWYGFVLASVVLLLALIRNFSVGGWAEDWLEHYQRARFFVERPPLDTRFVSGYWLPARPPLMNLVCAHFMAHLGTSFTAHQIVMALLNATIFVPLVLFAKRFAGDGRLPMAALVAFLVTNPMFVQNATYGWTRHLTSFYVLSAIHLYLRARETGEPSRWIGSVAAGAAAVVTHYSAAPYVVVLGVHFVVFCVFARRVSAATTVAAVAIALSIVGAWIGWSTVQYGTTITFGSNTTVMGSRGVAVAEFVGRVASNVWNTVVPHMLRSTEAPWLEAIRGFGWLKDSLFLVYQTNFPLAFGSTGALLLAYELFVRRGFARWSGFWIVMVVASFVIGIAVVGSYDQFGLAHVCGQPLVFMGLALLASSFSRWPPTARRIAVFGFALDLVLGVFLVLAYEVAIPPETLQAAQRAGFSAITLYNWRLKEGAGLVFVGDELLPLAIPIAAALATMYAGLVIVTLASARSRSTTCRGAA